MGLSWQQGPLAAGAVGRFLVPAPLPERLLYAEPLRRRVRVRFGGSWIADSEDVVLLHEPGHYPVAYFPLGDVAGGVLEDGQRIVGILVLEEAPSGFLLDNIAVLPELHGKGYGRALIEFAEAQARDRGFRDIRLYTHALMTENIALYRRIGFTETHRVSEKGYDRVYMTKHLL